MGMLLRRNRELSKNITKLENVSAKKVEKVAEVAKPEKKKQSKK